MMPAIMRMWAQKTGVPYEWLRDGVWPDETPAAPVKAQAKKVPAKKVPAKKVPATRAPAGARGKAAATRRTASR